MKTDVRILDALLIAFAGSLILAMLSSPAWSSDPEPAVESVLVQRINAVRAEHGLEPLAYAGDGVRDVARLHSQRMLVGGFFAHRDDRGRSPGDRLSDSGVEWRAVGENLLQEVGPSNAEGLVANAVSAWYESPDHRANILNTRYTQTAVGMVSRHGRTYLTQIFLAP